MAAKRKATRASSPPLLEVLGTLRPPKDAWGLTRAAGLGASAAAEAYLGCGYPQMIVTVDAASEDVALDAFHERYPHGEVPATMPRGDVRKLFRVRAAGLDPDAQATALCKEEPLALDEDTVADWLENPASRLQGWLLEAELGTEAVLDAAIAFLPRVAPDDWRYAHSVASALRGLGAMLYRVPAAARARYVEALEALHEPESAGARSKAAKALDVILHGRKGVERSGDGFDGRLFLAEYAWAGDDPAWVADRVLERLATLRPADREIFDPQVVVAGGAALIEAFRSSQSRFQVPFRGAMTTYATLFRA